MKEPGYLTIKSNVLKHGTILLTALISSLKLSMKEMLYSIIQHAVHASYFIHGRADHASAKRLAKHA